MEWIFEGIGTQVLSLILGLGIGGSAGYFIGINKNIQKQKAKDNSVQIQVGGNNNYEK